MVGSANFARALCAQSHDTPRDARSSKRASGEQINAADSDPQPQTAPGLRLLARKMLRFNRFRRRTLRTANLPFYRLLLALRRTMSPSAVVDRHNLGRIVLAGRRHRRGDPGGGAIGDGTDRVVGEVRIDFGGSGLFVP